MKLKSIIPYIVMQAFNFYLTPLFINSTGGGMITLLCIMPVITLACSLIHGARHGFGLALPIATLILFIPAIFIFFNASAWIYAVIYTAVALAGSAIGSLAHHK